MKIKDKQLVIKMDKIITDYIPYTAPLIALLKSEIHEKESCNEVGGTKIEWYENEGENFNYLQIFHTEWLLPKKDEDFFPYSRIKNAEEHFKKIGMAFWYGKKNAPTRKKDISASDFERSRKTDGILTILNKFNRIFKLPTNFNKANFYSFICKGYALGFLGKILFVNPFMMDYLISIFKRNLRESNSLEDVKTFVESPYRCYRVRIMKEKDFYLTVVEDKLLDKKTLCLLDLEKITYCYLRNRDTQLKTNIQGAFENIDSDVINIGGDMLHIDKYNNALVRKDQFITECGLRLLDPWCHLIGKITTK